MHNFHHFGLWSDLYFFYPDQMEKKWFLLPGFKFLKTTNIYYQLSISTDWLGNPLCTGQYNNTDIDWSQVSFLIEKIKMYDV